MQVHNLMEDIVKSCLKEVMKKDERLQEIEESKLNDIMALALNQLPTRYVTTSKGEMYAKTQLRSQVEMDVYRELANATEKVTTNLRDPAFREDGHAAE